MSRPVSGAQADSHTGEPLIVRVPASSANLGPGFDVLGMALDLTADLGIGPAPGDATRLDEPHPAMVAFRTLGGIGPLWMRSPIPMGRGLGFSGAVRVGGAALAVIGASTGDAATIALHDARPEILRVCTELEGHGDNVAASIHGGIVASVEGRAIPLRLGPRLAGASVVVWIPQVTTSTDRSRAALADLVDRHDVTVNLARLTQLVLAVEHDDPALLVGATDDRLHQPERLRLVAGAADALAGGVESGAWCGWLSGSGPTIAFLCAADAAVQVVSAMPANGHCKVLRIDVTGARIV